jgi:hypothetical protein
MRKLTRSLTLAVMLAATGAAIAQPSDIPTGTDPVPPPTLGKSTTLTTIASMLEVLAGVVL